MIEQGIEIVQKAIAADGEEDFEKALSYYRDALARFTMGLKYEKNEARKKLVLERVEGYMKRAEEISDYLKKQGELDKGGGGGGVAAKNKDGKEEEVDAEKKKLRGALSSAIVSEKPNVSWDDVAGLANAKESLKEVCLLVRCGAMAIEFTRVDGTYLLLATLLLHRRLFCRPDFRSYSPENASPLKEFYSMDLLERVNLT